MSKRHPVNQSSPGAQETALGAEWAEERPRGRFGARFKRHREQEHGEAPSGQRIGESLFHRFKLKRRKFRIERLYLFNYCRGRLHWI